MDLEASACDVLVLPFLIVRGGTCRASRLWPRASLTQNTFTADWCAPSPKRSWTSTTHPWCYPTALCTAKKQCSREAWMANSQIPCRVSWHKRLALHTGLHPHLCRAVSGQGQGGSDAAENRKVQLKVLMFCLQARCFKRAKQRGHTYPRTAVRYSVREVVVETFRSPHSERLY